MIPYGEIIQDNGTLFAKLVQLEQLSNGVDHLLDDVNASNPSKEFRALRAAFSRDEFRLKSQEYFLSYYGENFIVQNAIEGRRTIENSLMLYANINKGIKRFLPRREDYQHNKGVALLGQLVSGVGNLNTRNFFYPDNFVTGVIEFSLLSSFLTYVSVSYLLHNTGIDFDVAHAIKLSVTSVMSTAASVACGVLGQRLRHSSVDSVSQAKYLDERIKEIYHKA